MRIPSENRYKELPEPFSLSVPLNERPDEEADDMEIEFKKNRIEMVVFL